MIVQFTGEDSLCRITHGCRQVRPSRGGWTGWEGCTRVEGILVCTWTINVSLISSLTVCGGTLNAVSGIIQSPGYTPVSSTTQHPFITTAPTGGNERAGKIG